MRITRAFTRQSLARQYMIASLVVLVCGMAGVGWWVSKEIKDSVVQETAATAALYTTSFVAPLLQDLVVLDRLRPQSVARLDRLMDETQLGRQVVTIKVWNRDGIIVYSTAPELIGKKFSMSPAGARAWNGRVTSSISSLDSEEHAHERRYADHMLETYSPVRNQDGTKIIAVAEFYQTVDTLQARLSKVTLWTWLQFGGVTVLMYSLLAGVVRRGSDTIERQQRYLREHVGQLRALLAQNDELHRRVRWAASGAAARNERFLRRVSADLHDGPAQAVGAALLRLDSVMADANACDCERGTLRQAGADLDLIQNALNEALSEIRVISSGLALPQIEALSLCDTTRRVVRSHEQRTGTRVELDLDGVTETGSLPLKITVYRVVQEALSNAHRHAEAANQTVRVAQQNGRLHVMVSDSGPGFEQDSHPPCVEHLGLDGMRQRVESIGGTFRIVSCPGTGTQVIAELPLDLMAEGHA